MKIKDGFLLREVAGMSVVVAVEDTVKEFNGLINLNETGAFLWKQLEKEITMDELLKALLNEYDVNEKIAHESIIAFLNKLRESKLLAE